MLKEASLRVGAEASDLGELKAPSMPGLKVSPLDRLGSMAAIGAVAAVLANPERQWAQAIEGPPPVIIALDAKVSHHYFDFRNPSNDQYLNQERFTVSPGRDSEEPLVMKGTMIAGEFNQVANLFVTHRSSRLEFLFNISLKGSRDYSISSYALTRVTGYVFVADPSYRLNVKWSGTAESSRVFEDNFVTHGGGGSSIWPWPEGIMSDQEIASARYEYPSFSSMPHLEDKSTFAGEVPLWSKDVNTRVYEGHKYYLTKFVVSGSIKTYAGSNFPPPWGLNPPEPPAYCSQDAMVSMSYEYSIIGGADPEVKLEREDPQAVPLVGSPFSVRAIAKDNDTLGPNPQIRGYEWVNATSVPGDPSRAVVKPTHVGPLEVEVRVVDNEGRAATNRINLDVSANQICFYVDRPMTQFGTGHAFVGLSRIGKDSFSMVRGFYPPGETGVGQMVRAFNWGRRYLNDEGHPWDYRLCYFIDEQKKQAAQEFLEAFANNEAETYNAFSYNCVSFVEAVAAHLELALPSTRNLLFPDPWFFGGAQQEIFEAGGVFAGGVVERHVPENRSNRRRVAPMGDSPNYMEVLGPLAVLHHLASNPAVLASNWGLPFDSRQLLPITVAAGSKVTITTPPRDIPNSLSMVSWGDSSDFEAQPTIASKVFSVPGTYLVRFAFVDNFQVWSAFVPVTVVASGPATQPEEKNVTITAPLWKGQLEIHRVGRSQIRLFVPSTGRELLIQRTPQLPFGDSLPWDSFGLGSILEVNISGDGSFFRVRQGP